MHRTQLYIPDELYAKAKAMAALEGMSISEYVREGLFMRISAQKKMAGKGKKSEKTKDPLAHIVGIFGNKNGKKTNIALNHNDIYDL